MKNFAEEMRDSLLSKNYRQVRRVVIQKGTDWTEQESLFVWILVDDSLSEEELSWNQIEALVEEARSESLAHNPELYPYVKVKRESEWREMVAA